VRGASASAAGRAPAEGEPALPGDAVPSAG
jgi:hypothetical protein